MWVVCSALGSSLLVVEHMNLLSPSFHIFCLLVFLNGVIFINDFHNVSFSLGSFMHASFWVVLSMNRGYLHNLFVILLQSRQCCLWAEFSAECSFLKHLRLEACVMSIYSITKRSCDASHTWHSFYIDGSGFSTWSINWLWWSTNILIQRA